MTHSTKHLGQATTKGVIGKENLAVCVFGSFTTVFVMPFLPIYVADIGVRGDMSIYSAQRKSRGLSTQKLRHG